MGIERCEGGKGIISTGDGGNHVESLGLGMTIR